MQRAALQCMHRGFPLKSRLPILCSPIYSHAVQPYGFGHARFGRLYTQDAHGNLMKVGPEKADSLIGETVKSLSQNEPASPDLAKGPKPPLLARLKEGALHYWHGSKLLAFETRVSTRLLLKLLRGETLIRRERLQLLRTSSDLLRLVPFIVIVAIPFLEFALPILLKLFPNMLPSTFEDKVAAEEKTRKQIKLRLEMAKFLQDAVEQMSAAGSANAATKEFAELYRKARITGEPLTMQELVKLCHSLKDTLTLENLDRTQLVSLCKYMGIRAFGTDPFLRYQARRVLRNIYKDDELIAQEGVNSLTIEELAQACRLRGLALPSVEKSEAAQRRELNSWLELHVKQGIPSVILILSRAMSPSMSLHRPTEAIKDVILGLPDVIVNEAELHRREVDGSVSYKEKLHVLEQQQKLIAEELEQAAASPQDKAGSIKGEIKAISEAISMLTMENPVEQESQQLQELKVEQKEFKEEAEQLKKLTDNKLREPKAAELINEKLDKLIVDLESDLQELREKLGARLNLLSLDNKGSVTVAQLNLAFQLIKKTPTASSRLDEIISKFDKDGDGVVLLSDILQLAKEAEEEEGQGVLIQEPEEKTKD